jgi:hypothetical protein
MNSEVNFNVKIDFEGKKWTMYKISRGEGKRVQS